MTTYLGAAAGLLAAAGILLVISFIRSRSFSLEERIEPYVVDNKEEGRFLGLSRVSSPLGVWAKAVEPLVAKLDGLLSTLSSNSEELTKRLNLAGKDMSVHEFRITQLLWGTGGLTVGILTSIVMTMSRPFQLLPIVTIMLLSPVIALLVCDYILKSQILQRQRRILSEFPTIAEILALSVSCGEGPLTALERVANSGNGELAHELEATVAQVRSGMTIAKSLESLGERTGVDQITRFADGVAVAVERGTPLAAVLKAQARDARDLGHRELMELGGKKELLMLVPVVFLILPITVIFALYPSLAVLDMGF